MALTIDILEATGQPTTYDELSRRLGVPVAFVVSEVERLRRRGYLRTWACEQGACGACSLRATCAGVTTGTYVVRASEGPVTAAPGRRPPADAPSAR